MAETCLLEEETKVAKNFAHKPQKENMLKQEYRLKKKYQFNYVYRVGRSIGGKFCIVYFAPSKNKNVKIGISVSHKIGGAIIRNKTKRRIREAVYPFLEKLKKNFNVVIIAKNAILDATFLQIEQEIEFLLKKSALFEE